MPALVSTLGWENKHFFLKLSSEVVHLIALEEEEVCEDLVVDDDHGGVLQVEDHLLGSRDKLCHPILLLPGEWKYELQRCFEF